MSWDRQAQVWQIKGELMVLAEKVRGIVRWVWANFLAASGVLWWAKRQLRGDGGVVTLIFHRVLGESSYRKTLSQPEIIVREHTFRELVAYIARRYQPVELTEAALGTSSRKLKVAFTFDDGWGDNYRVAFPIIREYGVPLLIFITSGLVGKNAPFWPEQVIALMRAMQPSRHDAEVTAFIEDLKKCVPEERERRLTKLREQANEQGISFTPTEVDGTLSWPEIAEMDRAGIRFGSHTQSHLILTTAQPDTVRQEVLESKAAIESALGERCDTFSFPNGNWSPETRRILAEAGYKLAVTSDPGAWTATCDPLSIPRFNIYEEKLVGPTGRFSPSMLEYATFWKAWRATRIKSYLSVQENSRIEAGLAKTR
jgi:peptidoglycan/xylan/chitin deacetylase (PgdA/CDA1 family)